MTAGTLALTDFLLARFAEDEAEARRWQERQIRWPSRKILAECEAKRRIVELHQANTWPEWPEAGVVCASCTTPIEPAMPARAGVSEMVRYPCTTLFALAQPYADHPDYREEWRA